METERIEIWEQGMTISAPLGVLGIKLQLTIQILISFLYYDIVIDEGINPQFHGMDVLPWRQRKAIYQEK